MATEIHSDKMSQVGGTENILKPHEDVQTPTEGSTDVKTDDFLEGVEAADAESFNVCISCD